MNMVTFLEPWLNFGLTPHSNAVWRVWASSG